LFKDGIYWFTYLDSYGMTNFTYIFLIINLVFWMCFIHYIALIKRSLCHSVGI
jgi:hypothetical protein